MNEYDFDVRRDRKFKAVIGGRGSALGAYCSPRQDGGRPFMVLGVHDWRLLPAVVPLAHRQSQECSAPRHTGERKGHWLPALQKVQSRRSVDRTENAALVAKACRIFEQSEEEPS